MYCIFSGVTKASFELFILRIINNHMLHFLNWDQYQNYNVYFLLNCWSVFTESRKSYIEKVVLIFCVQSCKRLFQTIATWIKRLVIVKLSTPAAPPPTHSPAQLHADLSVYPKFWGHQVFIYSGYCFSRCRLPSEESGIPLI